MSGSYVGYPLPSTVALINCDVCGQGHPETRRHCSVCGSPSRFIGPTGMCGNCADPKDTQ